jgi:hypothetical protein
MSVKILSGPKRAIILRRKIVDPETVEVVKPSARKLGISSVSQPPASAKKIIINVKKPGKILRLR